jgi:hypothetical protein
MSGRVISSASSGSAAASAIPSRGRAADRVPSPRIAELKAKLGDEAYMAGAILRIATVLSARITEGYYDGRRKTRR